MDRKDKSDTANPYAAPDARLDGPQPSQPYRPPSSAAIEAALAQLEQHLRNPDNLVQDRAGEEPAVGRGWLITLGVLGALTVAGAVLSQGSAADSDGFIMMILGGIFFLVFGLVVLSLYLIGRSIGDMSGASDPGFALWRHLKAMPGGRVGTVIASLAPGARSQSVRPPVLDPVVVGPGEFTWQPKSRGKDFLKTFARQGHGQVRFMKMKKADFSAMVSPDNANVATAEVKVEFISWPRWAQVLTIVLLVVARIVGIIVGVILWFTKRQVRSLVLTKTMIRGSNGLWYVFSPDIVEGQNRD